MAYSDFTIDNLHVELGLSVETQPLFHDLESLKLPDWVQTALQRGRKQALITEKSRSEFLVAPLLLALQELSPVPVAIYSGVRLDVDAVRGLVGECDFILSAAHPIPGLRSPIAAILEAKRGEIEPGLAQCFAQLVGVREYNAQRQATPPATVYGCVTNADVWQYIQLSGTTGVIDEQIYFMSDPGTIVSAFIRIVQEVASTSSLAPAA